MVFIQVGGLLTNVSVWDFHCRKFPVDVERCFKWANSFIFAYVFELT